MSFRQFQFSILSLLAFSAWSTTASAQWPSNPATNLAVGDKPDAQVLPKIAATSDGGAYICWFDNASGNYDVYLQRLDPHGNEVWPHNGILISNNTQLSSLVDWDMMADRNDCAVITFTDARAGTDLDVYAYRVNPQGAMLWGPNGITLSNNSDYEPDPRVCQTTDGSFVFSWARIPNTGTGSIRIQKLDPNGAPQYVADGIAVNGATGEKPAFNAIVAADNGSYIIQWLRNIASFSSPRYIFLQKFDANGNPLWGANPLVIYDTTSLPIAYHPILKSDGNGGALLCWHRVLGTIYDSFVQHVSANGTELLPHEGVQVSTEANRNKLDPSLAYVASTGEMIVAFTKEDSNQAMWGVTAQKISAGGALQWGSNGTDILALDSTPKQLTRSVSIGTGAEVYYFRAPTGNTQLLELDGARLDNSGALVWPGSTIVVSSTLAAKDKLVTAIDGAGVTKLAWHDNRVDADNVYAQNVNPDGTLGFENNCSTLNFCFGAPNTTGHGATMGSTGTTSVSANGFTLTSSGSPPHVNGFFFYGSSMTNTPLGGGFKCVGGSVFRLSPAIQTDALGNVSRFVDMTTPPAGSGPGQILPGSTHYFQWYYRNVGGPGGSNFNVSDGLRADFCP
jgi:hypothetical protein